MAAALLATAAAVAATATWPFPHNLLHVVGQASTHTHTLPTLTLSQHVPTPLSFWSAQKRKHGGREHGTMLGVLMGEEHGGVARQNHAKRSRHCLPQSI